MTLIVLGGLILAVVFAGIFAFTVWGLGWKASLAVWVASIAVTAVAAAGFFLISAGAGE